MAPFGNQVVAGKILFCVCQTVLALAFFIDLTIKTGVNHVFLQQAAGNKVPEVTV